MGKLRILLCATSFLIGLQMSIKAQTNMEKKVDTLLTLTKDIHDEVAYDDPIVKKNFGLEFNPARLLGSSANKGFSLTGTVSLLSIDRKAEIAFPFVWESYPKGEDVYFKSIDVHYRRFLGKHQNGFYLSAGLRYAVSRGKTNLIDEFGDIELDNEYVKQTKYGAMFGLGYRYFAQSGFYWGVSLSYGRYFNDTRRLASYPFDAKTLIDLELLKFGYTF